MSYIFDHRNKVYINTNEFKKEFYNYIDYLGNDLYYGDAYVSVHMANEDIIKYIVKLIECGLCDINSSNAKYLTLTLSWMNKKRIADKLYMSYKEYIIEFGRELYLQEDKKYTYIDYYISAVYRVDKPTFNKFKLLGKKINDYDIVNKLISSDKVKIIFRIDINSNLPVYFDYTY